MTIVGTRLGRPGSKHVGKPKPIRRSDIRWTTGKRIAFALRWVDAQGRVVQWELDHIGRHSVTAAEVEEAPTTPLRVVTIDVDAQGADAIPVAETRRTHLTPPCNILNSETAGFASTGSRRGSCCSFFLATHLSLLGP